MWGLARRRGFAGAPGRRFSSISLAIALLVLPASARADYYGAIAVSPSTLALGWAYDFQTKEAAEDNALRNCRNHAGDCIIAVWFRNACGAIAFGQNRGWGSAWGTNRSIAEDYAVQSCHRYTQGCQVNRWVCTSR